MNELKKLGKLIANKRIALNLTAECVSKKAKISRATLSSLENGYGNCSLNNLINVLDVLDLTLSLENTTSSNTRLRASKVNTLINRKVNAFIIMCIEEYAASINESSDKVFEKMEEKGIIEDLKTDYEDLHGMSTEYINEYIKSQL